MPDSDSKCIVGVDIGYSQLKVCYSKGDEGYKTLCLPVGVDLDESTDGFKLSRHENARYVCVGEKSYIACVAPLDLGANYQRALNEAYASTDAYKALFNVSILETESDVIDLLVTGLPINQFMNTERKIALKKQLKGSHKVTNKRTIKVKDVVIVPQPFGGYFESMFGQDSSLFESNVFVVDPGFFSLDFALIRKCNVDNNILGTSTKAMSMVFDAAKVLIHKEYGGKVSIEKIEAAMTTNEDIIVYGDRVDVKPFISQAIDSMESDIINEIKNVLRPLKDDVDIVLMIGGGASVYASVLKKALPNSKHVIADSSELANAKGFWRSGIGFLERKEESL